MIKPNVVIIQDLDANHNDSNFINRLEKSFQYYYYTYACYYLWHNCYKREIHNIVGCKDKHRSVWHQTLAQWQSHLKDAGFRPIPLMTKKSTTLANNTHEDDNGCLVTTLGNRPLHFTSTWKLRDREDLFILISSKGIFLFLSCNRICLYV